MPASTASEIRLIHPDGSRSKAPLLVASAAADAYVRVLRAVGADLDEIGAPRGVVSPSRLIYAVGTLNAASDATIERELARHLPGEESSLRRREFDAYMSLLRAGGEAGGIEIRPAKQ